MPSTFINPVVNPDTRLGMTAFTETSMVRHWSASSDDEIDAIIRAIYKQVLGNTYVMESERQQIPESQFRRRELSVVEFIRQLAKSDLYRTRFFESCSRNRFIELNFKHFLGRAPESLAEVAAHSAILDNQGYEAEIDSYLDSDEYFQAFGSEVVPYYRGYKTGTGTKLVGFTHLFPLLRGASSSDKNPWDNAARLPKRLFVDRASQVVPPSGTISRLFKTVSYRAPEPAAKTTSIESPNVIKARSPYASRGPLQSELSQLRSPLAAATPFINPVVNPDRALGVGAFVESDPVRRLPTSSADEVEGVIRAVYNHILSNAHVMESERLPVPESQFRRGELSVIEFIRQVAKSDMYRTRFFENGPRNRFIELNFKHFLGRAPENLAEIAAHSAILENEGYEAEIDSYLDSDEYFQAFGADTVPYYRGYKTEAGTMAGFTHMFSLLRGASSSDKHVTTNNPARLARSLFADQASPVVSPSGALNRQGTSEAWTTEQLLKSIFSQPSFTAIPASSAAPAVPQVDMSELAVKSRAQVEQIAALKAQLDELRTLSNMGAAMLRKGQRPPAATAEPAFGSSGTAWSGAVDTLEQEVNDQAAQIEKLQGELMSARSLATIAESKLNKWRQRSY